MSYTVSDLKQDLTGQVHGTSLDKITNLNQLIQRAGRNLLSRIDPADTIRKQQIAELVHSELYNYTIPSDLKGRKIIDIKPQTGRQISESFSQRFSKRFDQYKTKETFSVGYNKGVKTLRCSFSIGPTPKTIHGCNSLTDNGTWSADGTDATNFTRDTLNYLTGGSSLNFDLTGIGTTGYIENSDMTEIDLSDYEDTGEIFARVYIPDAVSGSTARITQYELRWGSDSSNYWSATATSPYDQSSFVDGWQTIKFSWNGATETGSPNSENIDYLRLTVTYDGAAETDLRLDQIVISNGEIWEIEYYSECLFEDTDGNWNTEINDDDDVINLDTDGINLFLYECLLEASQQMQGEDSGFDSGYARNKLGLDGSGNIVGGLYQDYRDSHPSEALKPKSVYYNVNLYNKFNR